MSGSTKVASRSLEIVVPEGPASAPTASPQRRSASAELADRLMGEIILRHTPGRRVLDLGRGSAEVSQWAERSATSFSVVDAVDLGRGAQVRLPLPASHFDLVFSIRTLPHLGHDEESSQSAAQTFLAEVARIVRPEGTALIAFDNPRSLWGLYNGVRRPMTAVERGALLVDSDRGVTRFDTLGRFKRMLPSTLHLSRLHGIRVITHLPGVLHIPLVGRMFEATEWWIRDRSLFSGLGAHILVELRRLSYPG